MVATSTIVRISTTNPIARLAIPNPFPLYLSGFFLNLPKLIAPNIIATIPQGIPAINNPVSPTIIPARPNGSVFFAVNVCGTVEVAELTKEL